MLPLTLGLYVLSFGKRKTVKWSGFSDIKVDIPDIKDDGVSVEEFTKEEETNGMVANPSAYKNLAEGVLKETNENKENVKELKALE